MLPFHFRYQKWKQHCKIKKTQDLTKQHEKKKQWREIQRYYRRKKQLKAVLAITPSSEEVDRLQHVQEAKLRSCSKSSRRHSLQENSHSHLSRWMALPSTPKIRDISTDTRTNEDIYPKWITQKEEQKKENYQNWGQLHYTEENLLERTKEMFNLKTEKTWDDGQEEAGNCQHGRQRSRRRTT